MPRGREPGIKKWNTSKTSYLRNSPRLAYVNPVTDESCRPSGDKSSRIFPDQQLNSPDFYCSFVYGNLNE